MVTIGEKTKKIVQLYNDGLTVDEIAVQFGISPSSVTKRIKSFEKIEQGYYTPSSPNYKSTYQKPTSWSLEQIKEGFDRFIAENGRLPTADEVDSLDYLPSARQIQRRFGGLANLREQLGYEDVHFGRGSHRSTIQKSSRVRGNEAELTMYKWLVERFGEPFVHSEKEYGDVRNRADFLVYAKGLTIGIDVFATNTLKTLRKNVDIKAKKYVNFPSNLPLLFISWGGAFTQDDINRVCRTHLDALPNLRVMTAESAFEKLLKVQPLEVPIDFKPMKKST